MQTHSLTLGALIGAPTVREGCISQRTFLSGHGTWVDPSGSDLSDPAEAAYRFRPCFSWLETQSAADIAAPSEISPASATPPTISASLLTLPGPWHCRISRHSRCVASPVPPPYVATMSEGMVSEM